MSRGELVAYLKSVRDLIESDILRDRADDDSLDQAAGVAWPFRFDTRDDVREVAGEIDAAVSGARNHLWFKRVARQLSDILGRAKESSLDAAEGIDAELEEVRKEARRRKSARRSSWYARIRDRLMAIRGAM